MIGRRSAMFKLASGRWVSPALLEGLYAAHAAVADILVCGNSSMRSVAAAVVISDVGLQLCETTAGGVLDLDPSPLLRDFARIARAQGLPASHVPQV